MSRILSLIFLSCAAFLSAQVSVVPESQKPYSYSKNLLETSPKETAPAKIAEWYADAVQRLADLNEPEQFDVLLALVKTKYPDNIPLLIKMAELRWIIPDYGYRIGDQFTRGNNRSGTGEKLSCCERDRVFMLNLFYNAMKNAQKKNTILPECFYFQFASLLEPRSGALSWKLQALTKLNGALPEFSKRWNGENASLPPVNPDGSPVLYSMPSEFESARNDGERVRFLCRKAGKSGALKWADFMCGQFDPAGYSKRRDERLYRIDKEGVNFLTSLTDNETLAYLANGFHRLRLPEDQNYIKIYQKFAAHSKLAHIYSARGQFPRALAEFQLALKDSPGDSVLKERIHQIKDNLCRLESFKVQPAGRNPQLTLYFRNASALTVSVQKIDEWNALKISLETLSKPQRDFYLDSLYNLSVPNLDKEFKNCIGTQIAKFDVKLNPKKNHSDSMAEITLPVKTAGAYLVTAALKDGNSSQMIVWLSEYSLTMTQATGQSDRLLLNNAATGAPVPNQKIRLHFFKTIYAQKPADIKKFGKVKIETKEILLTTDASGSVLIPNMKMNLLWAVADVGGKSAFYNGGGYFYSRSGDDERYDAVKTFIITDRPIYKPGDPVEFSGFLRRSTYSEDTAFAYPPSVSLSVENPRGEKLYSAEMPVSRKTGAFAGRFLLPANAALGGYSISSSVMTKKNSHTRGYIRFRVEEYKKPEYQVRVNVPSAPVKLGDAVSAVIAADYYFGQPVADAEVKCTVYRETAAPYFPLVGLFDWLYGRGYLLPSTSFRWHFFPFYSERELVMETAGKISPDGKFELKIKTDDVKSRFGEKNYRYSITAEVTDSARRVISATGNVLVTAKPFEVFVYPLRGFTGINDVTTLRIAAFGPNGLEVRGRGVLKLFRRKLNNDGRYERTGECLKTIRFEGGETPSFLLNRSGVYEAYVEYTSDRGVQMTGNCTFRIAGNDKKENLFSDLPLEISTDRATCKPGESMEVLISTNKPGATVYLFTPGKMRMLRLDGYSKVVPFKISPADRPNIFVSVLMIRDGATTDLTKQLYVPPESRLLNVNISVPSGKAKPRTKVPVEIAVTGLDGKPVSGSFAVTVYDKALEGLAANNVPEINSFFWGWKRWFFCRFFNAMDTCSTSYSKDNMQSIWFDGEFAVPYKRYNVYESLSSCCSSSGFADSDRNNLGIIRKSSVKRANAMPAAADSAGESADSAAVTVRSDFLDRAFWIGQRELGKDGKARLEIPVPDNLTTWVVKVWSLTPETNVGQGSAEIIVSKDFIARLELPRFLVAGDRTSALATVHNYTDRRVLASLSLSGSAGIVECVSKSPLQALAPGKSVSVPFELIALQEGKAELILTARAGDASDAVRLPLPILVKGSETYVPTSGRLENQTAKIDFTIPLAIRKNSVAQTLSFSPGSAVAMVDLLPYLAADDSSNVFGVVNRFLPALSAKYALEKMGVSFADAVNGRSARESLYKDYLRGCQETPVFSAAQFEKIIADNLKMIEGMVNADGGWGWFSGYQERSYPDTTAYVVESLVAAKRMGLNVNGNLIERGIDWLTAFASLRCLEISKDKSVSNSDALVLKTLADAGIPHRKFEKLVFENRRQLSSYGLALLGLSLPKNSPFLKAVLPELSEMVKYNSEIGTAYLNIKSEWCFFWYGDDTSTQAAYLQLLLRETPLSPRTAQLARYLTVNVRNAPSRSSIRALGAAVRSLADYIRVSGEADPDLNVIVRFDEGVAASFHITKVNLWKENFTLELPSSLLRPGTHRITVSCAGRGAVYYNTMLSYFSLENRVAPAGLDMRLDRKYYELIPVSVNTASAGHEGRLQNRVLSEFKRMELKDLSSVKPGTLVEVELIADTKNDYDYVEFTDSLPAGFEYVKPVSGYISWWPPVYAEFKEFGPRFSQRELGRGKNSIRYRIRAQLDGSYLALPAKGKGLYAPELKCNTGYTTLIIK